MVGLPLFVPADGRCVRERHAQKGASVNGPLKPRLMPEKKF
jgi:hypothetical protein